MDDKDRELAEKLAIDAAVSEALANAKAKGTKVLGPHIRPACRVKWVDDQPLVVAMQGTKETTVDALVSQFKHDPEFAPNFYAAPNPHKADEDGIRRISVLDQENLNRYSAQIASGEAEVIYPPETRKKLDDNEVDLRDQASLENDVRSAMTKYQSAQKAAVEALEVALRSSPEVGGFEAVSGSGKQKVQSVN